jgi:hypothetical protein
MNNLDKPVFQENLSYFSCYTLVDITATGVSRVASNSANQLLRKQRNQQRNAETLVQAIGIRAQPIYLEPAVITEISSYDDWTFGSGYKLPARVWLFVFGVEHANVYDLEQKKLAGLVQDINNIPIITGLDETVKFSVPVFSTTGDQKNIHFSAITQDFFHLV